MSYQFVIIVGWGVGAGCRPQKAFVGAAAEVDVQTNAMLASSLKEEFFNLAGGSSLLPTTQQTAQNHGLLVVRCTESGQPVIQGAPNVNREKPRIAGLCGREVGACDHLSLSCAYFSAGTAGQKRNKFAQFAFVTAGWNRVQLLPVSAPASGYFSCFGRGVVSYPYPPLNEAVESPVRGRNLVSNRILFSLHYSAFLRSGFARTGAGNCPAAIGEDGSRAVVVGHGAGASSLFPARQILRWGRQ